MKSQRTRRPITAAATLVVTAVLVSANPLEAANHYIRQGATGNGSGSDWGNACPGFSGSCAPSAMVRGDTYYVANGSYGGLTLNAPTSGTSVITIRKAIIADHGTSTGWSDSYGNGTATFGDLTVATQYWLVDGQVRNESSAWTAPSGYGFRALSIQADSLSGQNASNSTFDYVDIGPSYTTSFQSGWGYPLRFVYSQHDITISHCALHNGVGALFQGAGADNITFEYCNIGPGWGKEALRGGNGSASSGWTVRYNRFWNASQKDPDDSTSGITAEIASWDHSDSCSGWAIYGNWFFNQFTAGRNAVVVVGGNGSSWVGSGCNGTVVYNNTFAGIADSSAFGASVILNGSSTIARNNLFYSSATASISAGTLSNNIVAGSSPFVDYNNRDFRLSGPTAAGIALPAPYNVDPLGSIRGGGGVWDVGAYEYGSGGVAPPAAPTNVTIIP
jgi:hypothetical protein